MMLSFIISTLFLVGVDVRSLLEVGRSGVLANFDREVPNGVAADFQ